MKPVGIDFCCNDPDNGLFAGRIEGIQLYYRGGDPFFELEARRDPAPMLTRIEPDAIRISGKRWPIIDEREWVGNWCWNRYWFEQRIAVDLIIWLRARDAFHLGCGEERLFSAWRSPAGLNSFRSYLAAQIAEIAA